MKNTHPNTYLLNTIRKRAIKSLIRQYKSGNMYDYCYQNAGYIIGQQLHVIERAYHIELELSRTQSSDLWAEVKTRTFDLLFDFYHNGIPINLNDI